MGKQIREKELKNKIAQLEKQLEVLMTQVTSKDEVIFNLTKNVKNMVSGHECSVFLHW